MLVRFAVTPRGIGIAGGTILGVWALIAHGPIGLGIAAILLWAMVLLLASLRQSELNNAVKQLRQDVREVGRLARSQTAPKTRKAARYGPFTKRAVPIERARQQLNQVRSDLTTCTSAGMG